MKRLCRRKQQACKVCDTKIVWDLTENEIRGVHFIYGDQLLSSEDVTKRIWMHCALEERLSSYLLNIDIPNIVFTKPATFTPLPHFPKG